MLAAVARLRVRAKLGNVPEEPLPLDSDSESLAAGQQCSMRSSPSDYGTHGATQITPAQLDTQRFCAGPVVADVENAGLAHPVARGFNRCAVTEKLSCWSFCAKPVRFPSSSANAIR